MKRCNNCLKLINEEYVFCPDCGYKEGNPSKQPFQLYPGTTLLDRYLIGEVLGYGGFGITYKAWDSKLDNVVAIKEFYPSGMVNRIPGTKDVIMIDNQKLQTYYTFKEKFLNEARNMAKFNSESNIVSVYRFFEENNTAYIVMEYLQGVCLNDYLKSVNFKISLEYAVSITDEIAKALSKLHKKGIIHRDISPDNIFLCSDGKIKLIDFGAARFSYDTNRKMTVILKHGFAPPEQYEWINKQGSWTDVYALGATLYFTLTGRKPDKSTDRDRNDTLIPPKDINPNIPEYISNTIMKAMSVDINFRFKNVDEFIAGLHQDKAVVPVADEKKKRKKKRKVGITVSLLLITCGLIGSAFMWMYQKNNDTLSDCEIQMWYCRSGDTELDEKELESYRDIIQQFNLTYPNVDVELSGFDEKEYAKKLKNSDEQPNLYEYMDKKSKLSHLSLEKIYKQDIIAQCSLLNQAKSIYGGYDYLPLGFVCPVVFVNTEQVDYSDDSVSSFSQIINNGDFAADYREMSKTFSESGKYFDSAAKKMFFEKDIYFYGTRSSNYLDVSENMTGQYKLLYCDTPKIYCSYSNVWTANDIDKKTNRAALKLLEFMLNDNAQDIIHIRNNSGSFPINEDVLSIYVDVYSDYKGFFDNMDSYIFER